MKKIAFISLLVIVLAFGFFGCDDSNGNELEFTFIGTWNQLYSGGDVQLIWTFYANNTFISQYPDELYRLKGTWIKENPNKFTIQGTHSNLDYAGVATIDELPEYYRAPTVRNFEFLSNSSFKLIDDHGGEINFIRQ